LQLGDEVTPLEAAVGYRTLALLPLIARQQKGVCELGRQQGQLRRSANYSLAI
jgi:hypothetical protein